MKPYYQDGGITIYNADCREILPMLEPVDLVLTDPPYGIGIANNPFRQKHKKSSWDDEPAQDDLIQILLRTGKEQVIWGGNYFNLPPSQGFLVWDKIQPEKFSSSMCEMAWISKQAPAKLFKKRVLAYTKYHPTQKPIELMIWCILQIGGDGIILDPFMGSGTTLIAAKELHRKCIGIEISEKYAEIAAKRLAQSVFDFG